MDLLPKEQTNPEPKAQVSRDLSPQLITILTTEHYNLQNGRASTIADAGGRAGLFISAVSTALVALAFIGQVSNFQVPFFVFSLILFPTLFFLGIVTFERTLQSTIEDVLYARGMSRLRHLFLEYAPDLRPYFILSTSDDAAATLQKIGMGHTYWQILLGTPGTIAVITSVIGGTFIGLLLDAIFRLPFEICVGAGIICFLASVGFSLWYHKHKFFRAIQDQPTLFPGSLQ
ncbi:MAG TPA: hypothetical protein VKR06_29720 [Ktedonosporobacter sp.]|nr:hypothetical protein [Ktedonosporobacter sp.]